MKKITTPATESAWDSTPAVAEIKETAKRSIKPREEPQVLERIEEPMYDLEGLMTDFPTARELEQFVYDKTGVVLNLKGRSNRFKYQTAMDVLNGKKADAALLGTENPYVDKTELVPVEPLKELPFPPIEVQGFREVVRFVTKRFPHPDSDWKASGQHCEVVFRKYTNNAITYEILGPIAARAIGTRLNKYGKEQPEKYEWIDPRQGEQLVRHPNGNYTPIGTRLRAFMQQQKINKTNAWAAWIDRDFTIGGDQNSLTTDPWALS